MPLSAVILAAGKSKRMRSSLPKVMHTLAGKTLLARVFHTASRLSCDEIYIVYGHEGDQLRQDHTGTRRPLDKAGTAVGDGSCRITGYRFHP